MTNDETLFFEHDLLNALKGQEKLIRGKVDEISKNKFMTSTSEQLLDSIFPKLKVNPLVIYKDRQTIKQDETKVTISYDPSRGIFNDSVDIDGIKVKIFIPFTGDYQLWQMQPRTFKSSFPRATIQRRKGESEGNLVIEMSQPHDAPPEKFKEYLDKTLKDIDFYVDAQRKDIEKFNQRLPELLKSAIDDRRQRIEKHSGIADTLGIPLREKGNVPD